jgi:hypothetical protein
VSRSAKVLENGNVLVYSSWGDNWTEEPASNQVQLEARGGSSYPDGEWEFSGSYDVEVKEGAFGNHYRYAGSLSGDYRKIKIVNGRRTRGPKFDLYLSVQYPGGRYRAHQILQRKGISKKKARQLCVDAIRAYEKTDHFKQEIWPSVIHPDRHKPIFKEVEKGKVIWIATSFQGGLWDYVRQRNIVGYDQIAGYGHFFSKEIEVEHKYPMDENGRTNWDVVPEKIYKAPSYSHVEERGGSTSGGWSDRDHNRDEMERKIDEAHYDLHDLTQLYIERQRIESVDWERSDWRRY